MSQSLHPSDKAKIDPSPVAANKAGAGGSATHAQTPAPNANATHTTAAAVPAAHDTAKPAVTTGGAPSKDMPQAHKDAAPGQKAPSTGAAADSKQKVAQ